MRKTIITVTGAVAAVAAMVPLVHAGSTVGQVAPTIPDAATQFALASKPIVPVGDPLGDENRRAARGPVDTRRVQIGNTTVVLGVGAQTTCLTTRQPDGSGSTGCAATSSATDPAKPVMSVDLVAGGIYRLTGLLPAGAGNVKVDGRPVPVQSNVFSIDIPGPVTVSWTAADGQTYSQHVNG